MIEDWTLFRELAPEAFGKIVIALFCGAVLGVEREMKEKTAGFRTLILITIGSTLYMIVSDFIALVTKGPANITAVDTSRVASQVVMGIGFLGGGAIIQARGSVRGLTTASTIWVAAGIGLCIGIGFPILAVAITLLVLLVLVVLDPIRAVLNRRGPLRTLDLVLPNDTLVLKRVEHALLEHDIPRSHFEILTREPERIILRVSYWDPGRGQERLLEEIAAIGGVRGVPLDASAS
jgi:putative Mg2+ transporter-C (MgtC) family protein